MATREAVTAVSSDKSDLTPEPRTTNRVTLGNPLLLTDFSPNAERALPYAVALAQQYSGKIYVIHVISPEMYEYLPPEIVSQSHMQSYGQRRMEQLLTQPYLRQGPCSIMAASAIAKQ